MKVCFLNPPAIASLSREGRCMVRKSAWSFILPPVSLAYCAAVLRERRMEAQIIDCVAEEIDLLALKSKIQKYKPDLVILNTATPSIIGDIQIANDLKQINPLIKIGAVGVHPTALADETFGITENLDFIIRGEPEMTIQDLALALKNDQSLSAVKGLSYQIRGKIFHNAGREPLQDLDKLPFPAWDLIDASHYKIPLINKPFLLIVPSRGCPHQCVFCNAQAYYGKTIRLRSPQKVADEIVWARTNFEIEDFHFWTESFTLQKTYALGIINEIIKRNLKIRWTCSSRVDCADLEILRQMKKAGCWMISFGAESGDQMILDNAQKGITLNQTRNAVQLAKKAGLEVSVQFIIGLPAETKKTVLQTIRFAKSLNADYAQFYCAVPFPGSNLYQMAKKNQWLSTNDWSQFDQNKSILNLKTLSAQEAMQLRKKAHLHYYFNPKQIIRTLGKIKTLSNLISFIQLAKSFKSWI